MWRACQTCNPYLSSSPMFDALSEKLQKTFKNLRGLGKISETNVSESLREVRMALLDADVNFKVTKQFISRVKEKALGEEVVASIQPGQQIVKIINDELTSLLGFERSDLDLPRGFAQPLCMMMCGLHGAGKTTSCGKLARLLAAEDRKPLLVGADIYRPAAMDQLETLAKQLGLPCFLMRGEKDVTKIAESYGKSMPMDYLVSLNQSQEQYNQQYNNQQISVHPAPAIMYIAKNRNGPKFQSVPIEINYNTMSIKETL